MQNALVTPWRDTHERCAWKKITITSRQRVRFRRRTLTLKRPRGAIRSGNLGVDGELELLHHVVVEGVGRTRKRVHDPDPVVDGPAARRGTAHAHLVGVKCPAPYGPRTVQNRTYSLVVSL